MIRWRGMSWTARGHLLLTGFFALTIIPTIAWWHDSVLWVGLLSVWALVATHAGAYSAARADQKADEK